MGRGRGQTLAYIIPVGSGSLACCQTLPSLQKHAAIDCCRVTLPSAFQKESPSRHSEATNQVQRHLLSVGACQEVKMPRTSSALTLPRGFCRDNWVAPWKALEGNTHGQIQLSSLCSYLKFALGRWYIIQYCKSTLYSNKIKNFKNRTMFSVSILMSWFPLPWSEYIQNKVRDHDESMACLEWPFF